MVRKSTRTICWIPGTIRNMPGPLTRQKRPSRKTTARSYSRRILIEETSRMISAKITMVPNPIPKPMAGSLFLRRTLERRDGEHETAAASDAYVLSAPERHGALDAPLLAMDARPALALRVVEHDADAADQLLVAADDGAPPRPKREAADEDDEHRGDGREPSDQPERNAESRHVGVDQHHRADDEGDHPAHAERAVARQEGLGDEEGQPEQHEREACVVDGQHVEREQAEEEAYRAGHARQHEARVRELEEQPVDTEHHQDQRHAGIGDHGEEAALPVGLDDDSLRAGGG